jgi:polyhydroxybutyrate depolymerase
MSSPINTRDDVGGMMRQMGNANPPRGFLLVVINLWDSDPVSTIPSVIRSGDIATALDEDVMYRHIPGRLGVSILLMMITAGLSYADDRQSIEVNGVSRTYVVRVPDQLKKGAAIPLVFVLHGGGGNAANAENMTGFTEKARQENFVVVYPEGSGRLRRGLFTWNAGHCCGYAMKNRIDDVAFINALIDRLAKNYSIDDDRIYVTGMSNGAMMAHRVGIELSQRVAAIAPVVGAVFGDERLPTQPVSALMINGLLDENVPFNGGPGGGRGKQAWDGTPTQAALQQGAFWAKANGCESASTKTDRATQTTYRYACPAGRSVELIVLKDNGHAWPGGKKGSKRGDAPSGSLDATDVIWEFFKAHPRA